jgi:hypothetical protein
MEGMLIFLLEDSDAPENNFFLSLGLRLSESANIVGVVVRCLQLFTPHLSSTAGTVKTKLPSYQCRTFAGSQTLLILFLAVRNTGTIFTPCVINGFHTTLFVVSNMIVTTIRATMLAGQAPH